MVLSEDDFDDMDMAEATVLSSLILGLCPQLDSTTVYLEMLKLVTNPIIDQDTAFEVGDRLRRSTANSAREDLQ